MGLLDPNEYIPTPEDEYSYIPKAQPQPTFADSGPTIAATGNMGALQRLSMIDNDTAGQLRDRMMARVRTPEQMDASLAQRRGALNSLNQEIMSPSDNNSFFTDMMMHSSLGRGKGLDWNTATSYAIGQALADKRKRQELSKGDRISVAKNNFDFEGTEEKAADQAENKAMAELSKIAVAQTKGAGGVGLRKTWTNVPGVGLVDLSQVGPDGRPLPKILVSSENVAKMYESFHKQFQVLANSPQMEGQFKSAEEMTQWIQSQATHALKQAVGSKGAPQEIVDQIPNLLTPQEPVKRPGLSTPGIMPDGSGTNAPSLEKIPSGVQQQRDQEAISMIQNIIDSPNATEAEKQQAAADLQALQKYQKIPTGIKPQQAAATSATPANPGLTTSAERAGQKKSAELMESSGNEIMKQWQTERNQANDQLNTYAMIKALRPEFETGFTAPIKEKVGAALDAFGIKGGMPKEARNLQAVNKMIREQVNARMTQEKGVQTEGDTQRFSQAYLNTQDTPYAFDLMLGMIKESSLRKQDRAQLAEDYIANNKSHAGIQKAWEDRRDKVLGPMLINVGGKPMWRHEYIEKAKELNSDADPAEVEAYAAKKWLELSKKGGK